MTERDGWWERETMGSMLSVHLDYNIIYIYIYIFFFLLIFVCVYIYIYIYILLLNFVCVYIYIYIYFFFYSSFCVYIYIYIYISLYVLYWALLHFSLGDSVSIFLLARLCGVGWLFSSRTNTFSLFFLLYIDLQLSRAVKIRNAPV